MSMQKKIRYVNAQSITNMPTALYEVVITRQLRKAKSQSCIEAQAS